MSELNKNPKREENTESTGSGEQDIESKPKVSGEQSSEKQEQSGGEQGTAEISKDARMFGMLCHLLGIFTWLVGPLIVWLIKREDDKFIDEQGKEAVNFQITLLIAYAVAGVTAAFCVGFFIGAAAWICSLIFCIMGAVKANKGEAYRYPVSIRFIK